MCMYWHNVCGLLLYNLSRKALTKGTFFGGIHISVLERKCVRNLLVTDTYGLILLLAVRGIAMVMLSMWHVGRLPWPLLNLLLCI